MKFSSLGSVISGQVRTTNCVEARAARAVSVSESLEILALQYELMVKGRIARKVEDLDDETLDAIAASSVSPEHAALDELIKGWKP